MQGLTKDEVMQSKNIHTKIKPSTLPYHQPMFLCVCSVGGRAQCEKQDPTENDNTANSAVCFSDHIHMYSVLSFHL